MDRQLILHFFSPSSKSYSNYVAVVYTSLSCASYFGVRHWAYKQTARLYFFNEELMQISRDCLFK